MSSSIIFILVLFLSKWLEVDSDGTVPNPYFHFPGGSDPFMGLIVTIAIPLDADTPGDVVGSVVLEANYVVPANETEYEYPPLITSSRSFIYTSIRRAFERYGYSGELCLLRYICEASEYSTQHTGVLGDLLHIILTPSSSKQENNMNIYEEAEKSGKKKSCETYKENCRFSIFNVVSKIGNYVDDFWK